MNVLAVGAHPDDIELGCGGSLLAHRRRGDTVTLLVMTTGDRGPRGSRSRLGEQEEAAGMLGADLRWGGFDDGEVPEGGSAVSVIEGALAASDADLVYTHFPADSHQDHRATSAATTAACRHSSRVLHYEGPTSIGFEPMLYVDIAGLLEAKLDLIRAHMSQVLKNHLLDLEAVEALARHRGFSARRRLAEAFTSQRFVWDLGRERSGPLEVELALHA